MHTYLLACPNCRLMLDIALPGTLLAVSVGLPLFLLGRRMVRRGFYTRLGQEPHCRHCEYNLTGTRLEVCPECGTALSPAMVTTGQRDRRPLLGVIGMVLLAASGLALLPGVALLATALKVAMMHLKSTWVR